MHRLHGAWLEPDGSGRTFEVGRRKNGKLIRIYEKGKQLGDATSPWVRWEVELHNTDRVIPWDVLARPSEFIRGAYPCLDWVAGTGERIKTIRQEDTIGYDRLVQHTRLTSGRVLNVMLERCGSTEEVFAQLVRPGVPRRLEFCDSYLKGQGAGGD
jgi:phage replication initiation protein